MPKRLILLRNHLRPFVGIGFGVLLLTTIGLLLLPQQHNTTPQPQVKPISKTTTVEPVAQATEQATASTTAIAPASTHSATPSSAIPPAQPTKPAKPVASTPQSYVAPTLSPTAISLIVSPQAATTTDGITFHINYTVSRDGSYTGSASGSSKLLSGPGKPNDFYCVGGTQPVNDVGTNLIIVNESAPNGIYNCLIAFDYGYFRFSTNYSVEVTDTTVSILPGATVIPGHSF